MCAYARAGMGWSESGPSPRTPERNARELHTLLLNAGIEGPTPSSGVGQEGTCLTLELTLRAWIIVDQFVVRGCQLHDGSQVLITRAVYFGQ